MADPKGNIFDKLAGESAEATGKGNIFDKLAGEGKTKQPKSLGQHVKEGAMAAWEGINPVNIISSLGTAISSPVETVNSMVDRQVNQSDKAFKEWRQGNKVGAVGQFAAGMIPVLGPAIADAAENIGDPENTGKGIGELVGIGASMYGPRAVKAAARSKAVQAASSSLKSRAQRTYAKAIDPKGKADAIAVDRALKGSDSRPGILDTGEAPIAFTKSGLQKKLAAQTDEAAANIETKLDEVRNNRVGFTSKSPDPYSGKVFTPDDNRFTVSVPDYSPAPTVAPSGAPIVPVTPTASVMQGLGATLTNRAKGNPGPTTMAGRKRLAKEAKAASRVESTPPAAPITPVTAPTPTAAPAPTSGITIKPLPTRPIPPAPTATTTPAPSTNPYANVTNPPTRPPANQRYATTAPPAPESIVSTSVDSTGMYTGQYPQAGPVKPTTSLPPAVTLVPPTVGGTMVDAAGNLVTVENYVGNYRPQYPTQAPPAAPIPGPSANTRAVTTGPTKPTSPAGLANPSLPPTTRQITTYPGGAFDVNTIANEARAMAESMKTNGSFVTPQSQQAAKHFTDIADRLSRQPDLVAMDELRAIRQELDDAVARSRGFQLDPETSSMTFAQRKVANLIRSKLAQASPEVAKANRTFSVRKNVQDALDSSLESSTGTNYGAHNLARAARAVSHQHAPGFWAAASRIAGHSLAALVESPIFYTLGANTLNKISNFLAAGNIAAAEKVAADAMKVAVGANIAKPKNNPENSLQ